SGPCPGEKTSQAAPAMTCGRSTWRRITTRRRGPVSTARVAPLRSRPGGRSAKGRRERKGRATGDERTKAGPRSRGGFRSVRWTVRPSPDGASQPAGEDRRGDLGQPPGRVQGADLGAGACAGRDGVDDRGCAALRVTGQDRRQIALPDFSSVF